MKAYVYLFYIFPRRGFVSNKIAETKNISLCDIIKISVSFYLFKRQKSLKFTNITETKNFLNYWEKRISF